MNKKDLIILLAAFLGFSLIWNIVGLFYFQDIGRHKDIASDIGAELEQRAGADAEDTKAEIYPRAIMMLIEYKDTEGLINFVNQLYERNIYSLLSVSPDFVEQNCAVIKELLDYNMEIVSQNPEGSFWDAPYIEQYAAIKGAREKIEACTGQPLRVVSSRYFASDENTVKAAEALGIPYVLARGTSGTEAIVFKPEEYNVKILSVSNIPSIEWKYGSLCDYSYWAREGKPEDMLEELSFALENNKVTPVSHANLGGIKSRWNEMWLDFFDNNDINWQSLDEFASADIVLPMWRIPRNQNAPYTPETRPLVPYDEEENVENPCRIEELPGSSALPNLTINKADGKIVMFHNSKGQMCIEAMAFLKEIDYPSEQTLNSQEGFSDQLNLFKQDFDKSEGVSENFGYYPIIFINNRVFSGFNHEIKTELLKEISE